MEKFMSEKSDLKFEMSDDEIDDLIREVKEKNRKVTAHEVARIHARMSSEGENFQEWDKKLKEAGIIIDFNACLEDEK